MAEWAGLGYYSRARNLVACARAVAERGAFPDSEDELRKLPGLGAYTAAAVVAIAFGRRAVVVDANVERVVARLYAIDEPLPGARAAIRAAADRITPDQRAGDFAQAMMDLGATICRPKKPLCGTCPLQSACAAFASGTPEAFPSPKKRRERPSRFGIAYWTERNGHVWLVRRPSKGLLGGMAGLPVSEWTEAGPSRVNSLGVARHVFTHFSLDLHVACSSEPVGEGWWQAIEELDRAGLPTLFKKAAYLALSAQERRAA